MYKDYTQSGNILGFDVCLEEVDATIVFCCFENISPSCYSVEK
jgi:hypothetical protein